LSHESNILSHQLNLWDANCLTSRNPKQKYNVWKYMQGGGGTPTEGPTFTCPTSQKSLKYPLETGVGKELYSYHRTTLKVHITSGGSTMNSGPQVDLSSLQLSQCLSDTPLPHPFPPAYCIFKHKFNYIVMIVLLQ